LGRISYFFVIFSVTFTILTVIVTFFPVLLVFDWFKVMFELKLGLKTLNEFPDAAPPAFTGPTI